MSPPTMRLPASERRATILEAAGQLFGELGYEAATLEDLAGAAGVTKPIVYRHFASKEQLYLAVLERHRDDLASFRAAIPNEGTQEQRLRAVLAVWLDYVETHSYAWKMLFRDRGGGSEIEDFRTEVHARAREVLAGLIRTYAQVRIRPREIEPLAELLSMGMASAVLWWLENPHVARGAVLDALARIWASLLSQN